MSNSVKQKDFSHDPLERMGSAVSNPCEESEEVAQDAVANSAVSGGDRGETGDDTGPVKILLEPVLNIEGVGSLHERLIKAFDHCEGLDIDASKVESVDTSAIQLLIILLKQSGKAGKTVRISNPSARFVDTARLLGATGMLGISG